ncbi:MAG: hypothetical protein EOO66_26810, partial [Methylobacterium sp.]
GQEAQPHQEGLGQLLHRLALLRHRDRQRGDADRSPAEVAAQGVEHRAVAVSEERETVEELAEPFLVRLGFLARTPRGRIATPAAWRHLGLTPPAGGDAGQLPFDSAD